MQNYIIMFVVSYLLGSFHLSHLLEKRQGKNLGTIGSLNYGASNAFMQLGIKAGVATAFCDGAKGFFAVMIARFLLNGSLALLAFSALCAILGHLFPIYYGFKGGKGLSTFVGSSLGIGVWLAVIAFCCVLLITLITNYIAVGAAGSGIATAGAFYFLYGTGLAFGIFLLCGITLVLANWPNYVRIANKTEMPFRQSVTNKLRKAQYED